MDLNLGNITMGTIIAIFIGIIFVMAIIPAIADNTGTMTTKSAIADEAIDTSAYWSAGQDGINTTLATYTLTNAPSGWKTTGCPISGVTYGNSSVDFTVTTDYTIDASTGILTILATGVNNESGNATLIDYTHCRDGYATESSTRAIVNLILVFAGLAVVASVLFYLFKNK